MAPVTSRAKHDHFGGVRGSADHQVRVRAGLQLKKLPLREHRDAGRQGTKCETKNRAAPGMHDLIAEKSRSLELT